MKKLKVGIAGFGIVGKRRKECIDMHPNMETVAVCDKSFQSSGMMEDGCLYFKNYKEIINQELDILFVCLTNDIAPEATIAALQNNLHVFCEKPPGRSLKDIEEVISIEKLNPSLKLMYGFNHRYHDSVIKAHEVIQSGELGKIINIRGVYGKAKLITFNQSDWRTKREIAGGGVLLDQGIHMVDLVRYFAGDFHEVKSYVSNGFWNYDVEDNVYALMKGQNNIVAMLNSSATQWRHRFNLDINLEKGSVILGGIITGTKSYGSETLTVVRADPDNDNGDPIEEIYRYNKDPSWYREVCAFAEAVIKNKEITTSNSYDAFQTMKLIEEIYSSDEEWAGKYNI